MGTTRLWYRQPAEQWLHALPVGNGRLGAMVFGGVQRERLQLSEESLWVGEAEDRVNPAGRDALTEIRRRLLNGEQPAAEELAAETLLGRPPRISPNQTLADLQLEFDHPAGETEYQRRLDLDTAIATTRFTAGSVAYRREVFASYPHQLLVMRLTADQPGALGMTIRFERELDAEAEVDEDGRLVLSGALSEGRGMSFAAVLRVVTEGGLVHPDGNGLKVVSADHVTLLMAANTSFHWPDPLLACHEQLRVADLPYETLRAAHTTDHAALFSRVSLDLGGAEAAAQPTDERLAKVKQGALDPDLVALYFQYGRYLLLGSSRPRGLPANLQGVWNDRLDPPWSCDYHFNINLQMNYWHAEGTALPECCLPLFEYLDGLREPGHDTAQRLYGCDGFVAHHLSDVFGVTTPCDGPWGVWPTGAAWLCTHLWEHYLYSGDDRFLQAAWPTLRDAAQFFLDYLTEDPDGYLISSPSASPESRYLVNGQRVSLAAGPAMDQQIIRDLLDQTAAAGEQLQLEPEFTAELRATRARLAPDKIGSLGQLLEWREEFEEAELGHRHVSHLYGFFPSSQITLRGTPELAAAVRKSLERRLEHGGGQTGWSRAWVAALWARFEEGELAHDSLYVLLRESTEANLFDLHPPHIFQIDGNCGASAVVVEMLLQSHAGELHLLPALPAAWPSGSVTGLRARGGFTVDLAWQDGTLTQATLHARLGGTCRVRSAVPLEVTCDGQLALTDRETGTIRFETQRGGSYELTAQLES